MQEKPLNNANIVRQHDHDRFLTVLMVKKKYQQPLFALYAFNHEIAKTREVVTDAMIGRIRLQWWRDAMDRLYQGDVLKHDVLQGLAPVIERLDQQYFNDLIDARELDFREEAPETWNDLVDYVDKTTTPLHRLACQILGEDVEGQVLKSVSVAYALTGILRSVPYHANQGRFLLPLDLLKKYHISPAKINDKNKHDVFKPIIEYLYDKILIYNKETKNIDSRYLKYLSMVTRHYLHVIKRHDYNVFIDIKAPALIWRLLWCKFWR